MVINLGLYCFYPFEDGGETAARQSSNRKRATISLSLRLFSVIPLSAARE
jgi:hypothetical protein